MQMTRLATFLVKESEDTHRRILGGMVNVQHGEVWSSYPISEQAAMRQVNGLDYENVKSALGIAQRTSGAIVDLAEDE